MNTRNVQLQQMNAETSKPSHSRDLTNPSILQINNPNYQMIQPQRKRTISQQENLGFQKIKIMNELSNDRQQQDVSPYRVMQIVNQQSQVIADNNQSQPAVTFQVSALLRENQNWQQKYKEIVCQNSLNAQFQYLTTNLAINKENQDPLNSNNNYFRESSESIVKDQIIKCELCDGIIQDEQKISINKCVHQIHIVCMVNYLPEAIKKKLKCPNRSCYNIFKLSQLQGKIDKIQLNFFKEIQNIMESRIILLENFHNLSICPKFNCSFYFFQVSNDLKFQCPSCMMKLCLECLTILPKDQVEKHNCYKKKLRSQLHFKICPKCNIYNIINKEQLRDINITISCSNCNIQYNIDI